MVVRKVLVGGGAAALLSLGTLIGGLSTGLVGAHSLHQQARQAQAAPNQAPSQVPSAPEAPDAAGADGPDGQVTLPAGSVSPDAAKQAAVSYIQSTAPYSSRGLSATQVTVNDEDGTSVYKVEFTGSTSQAVEVTVSAQGKVLKAEAGNDAEQAGAEADGPGGHQDTGTSANQTGAQTDSGASKTQPGQ